MKSKTVQIIEKGGRILLKRGSHYMSSWSNIAAGPDYVQWCDSKSALEMWNLPIAHALAKIFGCKVVVRYPKKKVAAWTEAEAVKNIVAHLRRAAEDIDCTYSVGKALVFEAGEIEKGQIYK